MKNLLGNNNSKVNPRTLEQSELLALLNYTPQNDLEQDVLDTFLLGCFTGLRFSCIQALNKSDGRLTIREKEGEQLKTIDFNVTDIKTCRKMKTNFGRLADSIILRRWNQPGNRLMGSVCNQVANQVIKTIAKKVGITKRIFVVHFTQYKCTITLQYKWELISQHTARLTYANDPITL